ncbi:MAG TPA: AhpC/TSA family protein [Candidatus Sphingobacterium stercoripullorum]|uniref:AhpC/TSA family protein n=1 Tax=Candidatus Sphingobacterium stercoripullorum TaxID=2838759 RepID=A0A9D2AZM8_9SPHI|nr:AhpC/TSA family protein [Candidatus Sphingobacterium stercoripullorum]
MLRFRYIAIILCLLIALIGGSFITTSAAKRCLIKGKVIGRPASTYLVIYKQNEDPRIQGVEVPIVNGAFEFSIDSENIEKYELAFSEEYESGSWQPLALFSEPGTIHLTLHDENNSKKNEVKGSKLTKEYWRFLRPILSKYEEVEQDFLSRSKQYLEGHYDLSFKGSSNLEEDLRSAIAQLEESGVDTKEVIKEISEIERSIYDAAGEEIKQLKMQYIKENPNIAGYSVLLSETTSAIQRNDYLEETIDISPYTELYKTVFAPKFLYHPYSEQMEVLLAGLSIKPGSRFVDFSSAGLDGSPVQLSSRISDKAAILHLWASWCGPCRKKGKELIPIYEEYKDRGLVVIGVARERSAQDAERAIKLDQYPWENLVEINDKEGIWKKYGIGNSGGMVFLINKKGTIVAKDPTASEVRNFLEREL